MQICGKHLKIDSSEGKKNSIVILANLELDFCLRSEIVLVYVLLNAVQLAFRGDGGQGFQPIPEDLKLSHGPQRAHVRG